MIAGEGSESQCLKQLARDQGIAEFVSFPGYVPKDNTVLYNAISWVSVIPSVTLHEGKEPWGLVVNDAFNQGLPVIASNAVSVAAAGSVKDGLNDFVVPEKDNRSIARSLLQILDLPRLRRELSENARNTISGWDNELMIAGFRKAIGYVSSRSGNRE